VSVPGVRARHADASSSSCRVRDRGRFAEID
jgi:hypothetical protein